MRYTKHQAKRYNQHYNLVCRMYEQGYSAIAHKVALCPQPQKAWNGAQPCRHPLCPYCRFRKQNKLVQQMYNRVYYAETPAMITLRPVVPKSLTQLNKDIQANPIIKSLRHKIIFREFDKHQAWQPHCHIIADIGAKDIEWLVTQLYNSLPLFEYNVHAQFIQRTRKDVYNVLCYATKVPDCVYKSTENLDQYTALTYNRKLITKYGAWARRNPGKRLTPYKERKQYYFDIELERFKYHRILRISTTTGEIRDITKQVLSKRE